MARVKYYDSTTQTWKYADMALQTGIHVGTTAPTNEAMLWVDTASNQIDSFPLTDVQDSDGNSLIVNQIAVIPSMPSGTNTGDILVWDGDEWVSKPKWQMIYQPVEYIEATGTQYIDTGVTITGDLIFELDIEFTSIPSSSSAYLMGVRDWNGNKKRTTALGLPSTPAEFGCNCTYPEANSWAGAGYRDTNRHLWHIESGDQKIDGTTFGTGDYSNAPESIIDFSLFARHDNSSGTQHNGYCKAKGYGAKYWKGNTLVRNYIPVYNVYTGESGMYDLVGNKFYGNNGTGNFILGPEI